MDNSPLDIVEEEKKRDVSFSSSISD